MNLLPHEQIAPVPQWIVERTAASKVQDRPGNAEIPLTDWDLSHNIKQATDYLLSVDIAIEGDAGDGQTIKTACWVRDYAISEALCLELMAEHWNERCEPPWTIDELSIKVGNAYRYAQNRPGERSVEAVFSSVALPPTPLPAEDTLISFDWSEDVYSESLEPDWVVEDYIGNKSVIIIFGAQISLKSFIALDMALCIANGYDWHGKRVKKMPVAYIAGEGRFGLKNRLHAWYQDRPHILPPDKEKKAFMTSKGAIYFDNPTSITNALHDLDIMVRIQGPLGAIYIDTLAKNMGAKDESSAKDTGEFMRAVEVHLRDRYNCAVIIIHHTGKGKNQREVLRGSSALGAGVDVLYFVSRTEDTLNTKMSAQKVKDGEEPPIMRLTASKISLGTSKYGKPITSLSLHRNVSGNPDPSVFSGNILAPGTKDELLALLPQSNNVTAIDSVWSLPGFTDRGALKIMLSELTADGLITLTDGIYKRR